MGKPKELKRSEKNQFLNHMHNELHITKDDIEKMIENAVEARVDRIIKQYSVYDLIKYAIRDEVRTVLHAGWSDSVLQRCVLKLMRESISFNVKDTVNKTEDD